MKNERKTRAQLSSELRELRRRVAKLEQFKEKNNQAEEALRESEEKYKTLMNGTTDFIFVTDKDNRVKSLNKAGARLLGHAPRWIVGKSIVDLFPGEIARQYSKNLRKVLKTGKPSCHQMRLPAGDREFWAHVNLSPLRDGRGKVVAVMRAAWDISAHKRTDGALRKHR